MMKKVFISLAFFSMMMFTSFISVAHADNDDNDNNNANNVPVINTFQNNNDAVAPVINQDVAASSQEQDIQDNQSPLTPDQRLSKLEQQMSTLQQMNISMQIENMQQEIQNLRGQVQVEEHKLKKLQQELKAELHSRSMGLSKSKNSTTISTVNNSISHSSTNSISVPATATSMQPNFLQDQTLYTTAYNLIVQQQYPKAIDAMNTYLKTYPQGSYAMNAHYWLGELYLIQNNTSLAQQEFSTVIKNYPNSPKTADAMLKLGFIFYDNGQLTEAKTQLEQVIKKYPHTTVARLAEARLDQIKNQANPSSG